MIDRIYISKEGSVFKDYDLVGAEMNVLKLGKVNILVGENNSGKSRFLRELFKSFRKREISNPGMYEYIDVPVDTNGNILAVYNELFASYVKNIPNNFDTKSAKEKVKYLKGRLSEPCYYSKRNVLGVGLLKDRLPSLFDGFLSYNEYSEIFNHQNQTVDL